MHSASALLNRVGFIAIVIFAAPVSSLVAQSVSGDTVTIRFADTDFRAAVQVIGRLLRKPVLLGNIGQAKVAFFETPRAVTAVELPGILRGLAEASGLSFSEDSSFYRIQPGTPAVAAQNQSRQAERQLDTATIQLHTVRLKHARAVEVAATLNQLFGGNSSFERGGGLSTSTLTEELRAGRAPTPPGRAGAQADAGSVRGVISIVPDEITNTLLIRASAADFKVLQGTIDQLDVRPLQVLIEVTVVEARNDRAFALSFGADLPPKSKPQTLSGGFGGAGLGDFVVRVMKMGYEEINTTLAIAWSKGDVDILSRPVILASNNTEAHLMVGTQQPFVSVSRSLPTDSPQRDQVVQYRNVGTNLTVRPTINQEGYVSLLIQQEMSATTGQLQFDAPVIATREAGTQLLVADGQTVVIGGLRDKISERHHSGIPLLSDIPLLGGLFGSRDSQTTETELFLFITPTIIASDEDAAAVTRARLPKSLWPADSVDSAVDTVSVNGVAR